MYAQHGQRIYSVDRAADWIIFPDRFSSLKSCFQIEKFHLFIYLFTITLEYSWLEKQAFQFAEISLLLFCFVSLLALNMLSVLGP